MKHIPYTRRCLASCAMLTLVTSILPAGEPAAPAPPPPAEKTWKDYIQPKANLRARYEYGDFSDKSASNAATLRARLGLLATPGFGLSFYGEYEGTVTPDSNAYNGLVTGDPNKTPIADPESHELNQLWGRYEYQDMLDVKAGRQRILIDNQRYVGNVGWRQNEQTFDAAGVTLTPTDGFAASYNYLWQVNRIFGSHADAGRFEDFDGSTHLIHLSYDKWSIGKLSAFAYLMDLGNTAGNAASNASYGLSLAGATPAGESGVSLAYYLEGGLQTDYASNPNNYQAYYGHFQVGPKAEKWNAMLGFEHLGSDNGVGYQFPLATGHKFNGFADRFLGTPAGGLQDIYLSGGAALPWKLKGVLAVHAFGDDGASFDYGQEVDAVLIRPFGEHFKALAKYAYYNADNYGSNTHRFTIELNYDY